MLVLLVVLFKLVEKLGHNVEEPSVVLLYYPTTVLLYYCITVLLHYFTTLLLYYSATVLKHPSANPVSRSMSYLATDETGSSCSGPIYNVTPVIYHVKVATLSEHLDHSG